VHAWWLWQFHYIGCTEAEAWYAAVCFFTNETILLKLTTVELSVPSCHMYCSVDVQVAPLRYFVSDDVLEHVLMEFKVDHHSFAVYLV